MYIPPTFFAAFEWIAVEYWVNKTFHSYLTTVFYSNRQSEM
jgi:hypothetical protein